MEVNGKHFTNAKQVLQITVIDMGFEGYKCN